MVSGAGNLCCMMSLGLRRRRRRDREGDEDDGMDTWSEGTEMESAASRDVCTQTEDDNGFEVSGGNENQQEVTVEEEADDEDGRIQYQSTEYPLSPELHEDRTDPESLSIRTHTLDDIRDGRTVQETEEEVDDTLTFSMSKVESLLDRLIAGRWMHASLKQSLNAVDAKIVELLKSQRELRAQLARADEAHSRVASEVQHICLARMLANGDDVEEEEEEEKIKDQSRLENSRAGSHQPRDQTSIVTPPHKEKKKLCSSSNVTSNSSTTAHTVRQHFDDDDGDDDIAGRRNDNKSDGFAGMSLPLALGGYESAYGDPTRISTTKNPFSASVPQTRRGGDFSALVKSADLASSLFSAGN